MLDLKDEQIADREVLVRGGRDQDRRALVEVLQAASYTIREIAGFIGPLETQIVGSNIWNDFADGILIPPSVDYAALFVLNIDHFQRISVMVGREVTSELLIEVSQRLSDVLSEKAGARLLHIGLDEFAILVPHMRRGAEAVQFGDMLLQVVSKPYVQAPQAFITARAGGVFYPDDAQEIEDMFRAASAVIHHESRQGRNSVHFYAEGDAARAEARFELEAELHQAILSGDLEIHYQPQLSLKTDEITGAEALVRWRRPGIGLVPAEVFVALAEDVGLISEIGNWVLSQAANECRRWVETGHPPIRVSINISAYQFRRLDMVSVVRKALQDSGLDPDLLTLEVTESLVLSDMDVTLQSLKELRSMGIHVELDDFGTGYSSLSYLKTLALDALKLDRSFIKGLPNDPGDFAVTEAVVRMAHAMGLSVTAEGVETESQRDCLKKLGCDTYQGFLASEALPPDEFIGLLTKRAHAVKA